MKSLLVLALLLALSNLAGRAGSVPLSTHGRWVVDSATGQRVKLRCVNWAGHMPAVIPEGLSRRPVDAIAATVASLGFNCVRLTWATYLWTDDRTYERLTVRRSLQSLGLSEALRGASKHNPSMLGLTVREAFDAVVRALGDAGVMVVLDNHVSRPQWCCDRNDGNGFFGDTYFDTDEWINGLKIVATRYKGFPQVVGMSMRNELRGPNQTRSGWYKNVARGANAIHAANPNVLVIVSGMSFDTDLSFLGQQPIKDRYDDKLVLEAHWYAFSEGRKQDWAEKPLPQLCSRAARWFDGQAGFLAHKVNGSLPLFVSEFGGDQSGTSRGDNSFLGCFMAFAAERDLDWALWALQGSYYWRKGVEGSEETFGVLDAGWDQPRNPRFRERFRLIQTMIQDPQSKIPNYKVIYHPSTGQCLSIEGRNVVLSDCAKRARWYYRGNGGYPIISAENTKLCLRLAGNGQPLELSEKCDDIRSFWIFGSTTGFGLIVQDGYAPSSPFGVQLCMERGPANSSVVLSKQCICLGDYNCSPDDPRPQWFKIISSNAA